MALVPGVGDGGYEEADDRGEQHIRPARNVLRSFVSTQRAFYTFINKTHRSIDLIWVNFAGNLEHTRTLHPNQFVDINTYRTHAWIAVDSILKQSMNINTKPVFVCPGPTTPRVRQILRILLPLRSLKLLVMLNLIENNLVRTAHDVRQLELPKSLERHLCEVLRKIEVVQSGNLIIDKTN